MILLPFQLPYHFSLCLYLSAGLAKQWQSSHEEETGRLVFESAPLSVSLSL